MDSMHLSLPLYIAEEYVSCVNCKHLHIVCSAQTQVYYLMIVCTLFTLLQGLSAFREMKWEPTQVLYTPKPTGLFN